MADEALGGSPHPCCSEGAPRSKAGGSRAQGLHGCPAVVRQRIERGGDKLPATANQPSVVDAAAGDCRIGVRSPGGGSHPETSSQKYSSKLLGMSGRSRTLDDMASAVSEPVGTFVCECVCLCVCVYVYVCVCVRVPMVVFCGVREKSPSACAMCAWAWENRRQWNIMLLLSEFACFHVHTHPRVRARAANVCALASPGLSQWRSRGAIARPARALELGTPAAVRALSMDCSIFATSNRHLCCWAYL